MVSADYITNALLDVQKELDAGRLQLVDSIRAIKDKEEKKKRKPRTATQKKAERETDQPKEKALTSRPMEKQILRNQEQEEEVEGMREKKQRRMECLEDLPKQFQKEEREKPKEDPSALPFVKKQRLFEGLSKEYEAASTLGEASMRGDLEDAVQQMKHLRKTIRKGVKEKARREASRLPEEEVNLVYWMETEEGEEVVQQMSSFSDVFWQELEVMGTLWTEGPRIYMDQIALQRCIDQRTVEHGKEVLQAELVTGKLRVELQWRKLDEDWRAAFKEPLIKAVRVYFDHQALAGVRAHQQRRSRLGAGRAEGSLDSGWPQGFGVGELCYNGSYIRSPGTQLAELPGGADGMGGVLRRCQCSIPTRETIAPGTGSLREIAPWLPRLCH